MELVFLVLLILLMATALASGFPVAFSLPGSAILTIGIASLCGYVFAGDPSAYFAQGGPMNWLSAGVTNFRGVYWEVERDTLIAIPLFVFMGIMLQRSKIAEDLLVSMAQLFGPVRGGLGISVVFVGALLAATTGIVGATVVAMGLISLPAMMRNKYSHPIATGTIAASGTLGQIIPPSIVLIILADQLASAVDQAGTARKALYKATTGQFSLPSEFGIVSTSAGDMFMGALVPGLVLVGLYMTYILVISFLRRDIAPAVPFEGAYDRKFFGRVLLSLVPPLTLIFVVLGSIIMGIATVNQAGAIGAAGAMIMAGYRLYEGKKNAYVPAILAMVSVTVILILTGNFEVNVRSINTTQDVMVMTLAVIATIVFVFALAWSGWRTYIVDKTLHGVMIETAKTTSLVFIILIGAAMLTAAFRSFGGEDLVKDFLTGLPGGFWVQFTIVMAVIFVLGFFLDFIEISVVVVPIVSPILLMDPSANVTAVWFGVMIGLNIQTSFLTPPFGFALFYLRGVAPAIVKTIQIYRGVIPFIFLQLIALVIVANFPALVNYVPNRISLLSETAPPPKNPRLQSCIEDYLLAEYKQNGDTLRAKINDAKSWDISYFPPRIKKTVEQSFTQADQTFDLLKEVFAASAVVEKAEGDYMPLHDDVRAIQAEIRRRKNDLKDEQSLLDNLQRDDTASDAAVAQASSRVDALKAEIQSLEDSIPARWKDAHTAFTKLLNAEKKARFAYRRNVDQSYDAINNLLQTVESAEDMSALDGAVKDLRTVVISQTPEKAEEAIKDVERSFNSVANSSSIKSALSKVRRELRRNSPDKEKVGNLLNAAIKTYEDEAAWRSRAHRELLTRLRAYEEAIRNNIGLREQRRLPRDVALYVASCSSGHEDISRYF